MGKSDKNTAETAKDESVKPDNRKFWDTIRYFTPSEFDSKDMPETGYLMNHDFIKILDSARDMCGFPFHVNSGYRTKAHNTNIGGAPNSTHMYGTGVDIRANTMEELRQMEEAFRTLGLNSIGLYKWTSSGRYHIHVDTRNRNVTWYQLDGKKDSSWL